MSHVHQFVEDAPPGFHGHGWRCACGIHFASTGCTYIVGRPHRCPTCGTPCLCPCDYCDPVKVLAELVQAERVDP